MSNPAMKPILRMEFDEFFTRVYGVKPSDVHKEGMADQYQQLLDAFFGGCLTAYASGRDFGPELKMHGQDIKRRAQAEAKYAN